MVVALEFAKTFEEGRAKVGSLEFEVMEESIVKDVGLSTTREKRF